MAEGESVCDTGDNPREPETRLDSISNEFKGILMDLHSSMMADENLENDQNPNPNSIPNPTDVKMSEDIKLNPVSEFAEDDSGDLDKSYVLPTAIINDARGMAADFFDTDGGAPGWVDFSSNSQIPNFNGTQIEYTSFLNENNDGDDGTSDIKTKGGETNADIGVKNNKVALTQSSFKIFVSNIPTGYKSHELRKLFEPYGTVGECEIFPYKNFAFVHLDSEEAGLQAIKGVNNYDIDGTKLKVQRSTAVTPVKQEVLEEEVGTFKLYLSYIFQGVTKEYVEKLLESYGRIVEIEIYRSNSAFVHMEEEKAGRKIIEELNGKLLPESDRPMQISQSKNPEGPSLATIKMQVKNISDDVTPEAIRDLFKPFGLITKCSVSKSKFDAQRTAIVNLEQLGDIRSAIKTLHGYELNGMKLVVEPLVEKPSPKKSHIQPEANYPPGYSKYDGAGNSNYQYEDYNYQQPRKLRHPPPQFRGGPPGRRGGGIGGPRGRGGRGGGPPPPPFGCPPLYSRQFQLVPMPSSSDMRSMRRGKGGMGMPRGRGGMMPPGFPRHPKRPYQPNFNEDYDFDNYYEDPNVASSREHYAAMEEDYSQFMPPPPGPPGYIPSLFGDNPPPMKRSRGRGGSQQGGPPRNLFPAYMPQDNYQEEIVQVPYQPHAYPSLNLPLGEREYFRNTKKQKNQMNANAAAQRSLLNQQQQYNQAQQQHQMAAAAASSYLVPEQIPSSSTDFTTAYPANYYAGMNDFNAVSFDYSNIKKNKNPQLQSQFPEGVDPNDYPNLKPGAKVYVNGSGKVMVRGNRGGKSSGKKKKKARRPGLGSKAGGAGGGDTTVTGANQVPVGGGNPNPSTSSNINNYSGGGGNKRAYKSKEQTKQENQEYSDWLQQKSWLFTQIPGTVKPAK